MKAAFILTTEIKMGDVQLKPWHNSRHQNLTWLYPRVYDFIISK